MTSQLQAAAALVGKLNGDYAVDCGTASARKLEAVLAAADGQDAGLERGDALAEPDQACRPFLQVRSVLSASPSTVMACLRATIHQQLLWSRMTIHGIPENKAPQHAYHAWTFLAVKCMPLVTTIVLILQLTGCPSYLVRGLV